MVKVAVIIKALNEEDRIAEAIESALAAVAPYQGQVVLADSASTDRTVEIGERYPILIATLRDPKDRSCGVGAQLGYQSSDGEYVYIMDGDMVLKADFLAAAVAFLDREPTVAGVGGIIREQLFENLEFRNRSRRIQKNPPKIGIVDRLNGGALYRRRAIESVGYLTDRNLKSYEEFDLGSRLRAKGWQLVRLDMVATDHYGHTTNAYRLLWNRVKSGYASGIGQVLRAGMADGRTEDLFRGLREICLWLAVIFSWIAVLLVLVLGLVSIPAIIAAALVAAAALALQRRSIASGVYSIVNWNVTAACFLAGLLFPRKSPLERIASTVEEGAEAPASGLRSPLTEKLSLKGGASD